MESYYTLGNFILYGVSLLVILFLVPLAVLNQQGKRSPLGRFTLWCLILALCFYPLSQTCPYVRAGLWFFRMSFFLAAMAVLTLLITLLTGKGRGCLSLTQPEADRWITNLLQGTYLVLDRDRNILGGHLNTFPDLPQPKDDSFKEYLEQFNENTQGGSDSDGLTLLSTQKEGSEGDIFFNSRRYHWSFTPLGERKVEGYLFSLLDLTEEQKLLEQRKGQEKLLALRWDRVREQGAARAREERFSLTSHRVKQSTEMIKTNLDKLYVHLNKLKDLSPMEYPVALKKAIQKGGEVMAAIRKTVHGMDNKDKQ